MHQNGPKHDNRLMHSRHEMLQASRSETQRYYRTYDRDISQRLRAFSQTNAFRDGETVGNDAETANIGVRPISPRAQTFDLHHIPDECKVRAARFKDPADG